MSYLLFIGDSAFVSSDVFFESIPDYIIQYLGKINYGTDYVKTATGNAEMVGGQEADRLINQYLSAYNNYGTPDLIIMTGGAADILNRCSTPTATPPCGTTFWQEIEAAFSTLFNQMIDHGVEKVLYGCPYHFQGSNAQYNDAIDYLIDNVVSQFQINHPQIEFVIYDPRNLMNTRPEFMWADGIHATKQGCSALAALMLEQAKDDEIFEAININRVIKSIPMFNHNLVQVRGNAWTHSAGETVFDVPWNDDDYSGDDVFCVLEVEAWCSIGDAQGTIQMSLFDVTASSRVTAADFPVGFLSTTEVWRSGPIKLTSGHSYRLMYRPAWAIAWFDIFCSRANLLVYQRGNITKTTTHIGLLNVNGSGTRANTTETTSTENFSNTTTMRTSLWKYEVDKWDGNIEIFFEAIIRSNNASYSIYMALQDEFGSAITDSTINTNSTTFTRIRSNDILTSLIDGRTYHPVFVVDAGGTGYVADIRIIIQQSNFSKTTTYLRQSARCANVASTNYVYLDGSHQHFNPWHGAQEADIKFESTMYIDSNETSETASNRFLHTQDTIPVEILETTSTSRTLIRSTESHTLETGLRYRTSLKSSSSNVTARLNSPNIIITYNLPIYPVVWGHFTDVNEAISRSFTKNWSLVGTTNITGSFGNDKEALQLTTGDAAISETWYLGIFETVINKNKYLTGDSNVKIEYKTGTTEENCEGDFWHEYNNVSFTSQGWIKIKISKE